MSHAAHPERFHALDATRAFALLLGVVFHAAWFFSPEPTGTAVKDVEANHFFGWFFHASHTFRMQVFYLIAGFFARLVYKKRGFPVFARNRLLRIGVPLVVGWLILMPAIIAVWTWGRNLSGQNPVDIPPMLAALGLFLSGKIFIERSAGGAFGMAHLWFLYYLMVFYILIFALRAILVRTPLAGDRWQRRTDGLSRFLAGSPLGALVFALLMTPLIWSMDAWFGVDTPAFSYTPAWNVTLVYFGFFALGWLLHRHAHRLGDLFRAWKAYLVVGLLASVALYLYFDRVKPYDPKAPLHSITFRDVEDWSAFRSSIAAGANPTEAENPLGRLWAALPPRWQGFVTAEETTTDQRLGILGGVNSVLADPDFLTDSFRDTVSFEDPRAYDPTVIPANREALQPFLAGVADDDYRLASWYWPTKLGYSALYSLVMVFLAYGCLGAFQALCQSHSPTWRYIADSSYWVYLLHIPLLPAIENLLFRWQAPSVLKFLVLCGICFPILYATYHYLVRSTFLGKLLNGRAYPFHWNPLAAIREITHRPRPVTADEQEPQVKS